MARDDFTQKTKDLLARRVGFCCSLCETPTSGPGLDAQKAVNIGEAAHIEAASEGGPRYNLEMTSAGFAVLAPASSTRM